MKKMHLSISKIGRTTTPIPAYIRDELNLENKQEVDVKRVGRKIVITPGKKEENR
jgi:bifunctional DNA-binding transcriptional regulator/antitoxin component of YhaV-PrlF toxin-antitoxin module